MTTRYEFIERSASIQRLSIETRAARPRLAAMRNVLVAAAIILLSTVERGSASETNNFVTVADPMIKVVGPIKQLQELCGVDAKYDACTRFVGFRLQGNCAPAEGGWTLTARPVFRPWIILKNLHSLPHERDHIDDVRVSAEAYAAALESTPFPRFEDCQARLSQETAAFGVRMQEFARLSTEKRHPRR